MGRLKFGVFLPFYSFQNKGQSGRFDLFCEIALECERLGYHAVWLDDHLMYSDWPILEPWTALSALSALTRKIRLGTMVSSMAHRNPALLAKQAAALDVISGGRLEFGVGAGAGKAEHLAYGFDYPRLSARVDRLAKSVEIIKRLWTEDKTSFNGTYFKLKDAVCLPKPLQKPHPPITVGGNSDGLLQKVTVPYADRFDFGYLPSLDVYKQKQKVLENYCSQTGRSLREIEKSCWPGGQVVIARNGEELEEKIRQKNLLHMSQDEFRKANLSGTPTEVREQLQPWIDLGVTYFMLYFSDLHSTDGLRLFAEEVMKPIQSGG